MSDIKNEVKMAIREFLEELTGPKVAAGATGFGPLPGDDRVYIQGGDGQESAWYRLFGERREYVLEAAFTGTVVSVNTRDASGNRGNTRKIDLTMRDKAGNSTTFVVGLRTKLEHPETTVGSKNLVAGLASCSDRSQEVTIAPRLGDTNSSVVLFEVYVDGVPVKSGEVSEYESAENLTRAMKIFGGNHTSLKGQEPAPAQVQPQRSAAVAGPVKATPAANGTADVKAQWNDLKFYLGQDDASVAETRDLILIWCKKQYGLSSPINIPASDQAIALHQCKEYLDKYANPLGDVVSDDWTDEVAF